MIDILKKLFDRSVRASEKYWRSQHAPKPELMPRNDQFLRDGYFNRDRFDSRD
jgi:hypothetical protein